MIRASGSLTGVAVVVAGAVPTIATAAADPTPAPIAGADATSGVFRFRIVDAEGSPIPGRITFVTADDRRPSLFPNTGAAPDDLAVRHNVVYTRTGEGAITVPIGDYEVFASRGLEWSIEHDAIDVAEGSETTWTARLEREVETTGWIGGDFHLHTLTYSGHGDSNLPERIISLVGEGVEFAVATDHNHNTDYDPTIEALGVESEMTAVVGNEISTPIGHFNAWPLDASRRPVNARLRDARPLFGLVRAEPNAWDVVPVLQLNHPRWGGIDYFGHAGLDPIVGLDRAAIWSDDFDAVEILNENVSWGYFDAEHDDVVPGASRHSALRDWFNLLNRGHRAVATGNSDSHTVHYALAGYPRNFVAHPTDDPAAIDVPALTESIKAGRLFTTSGPFVAWSIDGVGMGGMVEGAGGTYEVEIAVRCASWIDCDRVKVVVNGDVVEEIPVPDTREVDRLRARTTIEVDRDSWVVLLVEGDDDLDPIVNGGDRPALPIAIANPIRIDFDGEGGWTSPLDRARADAGWLAHMLLTGARGPGPFEESRPEQRVLAIAAAAEAHEAEADESGVRHRLVIREGLRPGYDRRTVLASAWALRRIEIPPNEVLDETIPDATRLAEAVRRRLDAVDAARDPYLAAMLLAALHALDPESASADLVRRLGTEEGIALVRRYERDLAPLVPGAFVDAWEVAGCFPSSGPEAVHEDVLAPERGDDLEGVVDRFGSPATWRLLEARRDGYLDLRLLDSRPDAYENAIFYASAWLHSPDDRTVTWALGTDDGGKVWINGEEVFATTASRAARPLDDLGTVRLRAGWNRVLAKVVNGGGHAGLYFRVLDPDVTSAPRRR